MVFSSPRQAGRWLGMRGRKTEEIVGKEERGRKPREWNTRPDLELAGLFH